jgi:hypothetical protein
MCAKQNCQTRGKSSGRASPASLRRDRSRGCGVHQQPAHYPADAPAHAASRRRLRRRRQRRRSKRPPRAARVDRSAGQRWRGRARWHDCARRATAWPARPTDLLAAPDALERREPAASMAAQRRAQPQCCGAGLLARWTAQRRRAAGRRQRHGRAAAVRGWLPGGVAERLEDRVARADVCVAVVFMFPCSLLSSSSPPLFVARSSSLHVLWLRAERLNRSPSSCACYPARAVLSPHTDHRCLKPPAPAAPPPRRRRVESRCHADRAMGAGGEPVLRRLRLGVLRWRVLQPGRAALRAVLQVWRLLLRGLLRRRGGLDQARPGHAVPAVPALQQCARAPRRPY